MMQANLFSLIDDYLSKVKECMLLFESKIGADSPLKAWREGLIPQKGDLGKGIEYQLHGIGCLAVFPGGREVDFDFGPGGRFDGLDLWRLGIFANSYPDKYPFFQDDDVLKREFEQAIEAGLISQIPHSGSQLYFYVASD